VSLPRVQPINPTALAEPFDHIDFLFEVKHDGFRAVAYINGTCELVSRKRNVYKSFPQLAAAMAVLSVKSAIIDGEIVCLDTEGRSQFSQLVQGLPLQSGSAYPAWKAMSRCRS